MNEDNQVSFASLIPMKTVAEMLGYSASSTTAVKKRMARVGVDGLKIGILNYLCAEDVRRVVHDYEAAKRPKSEGNKGRKICDMLPLIALSDIASRIGEDEDTVEQYAVEAGVSGFKVRRDKYILVEDLARAAPRYVEIVEDEKRRSAFITLKEAAARLRTNEKDVAQLISDGHLEVDLYKGRRVIDPETIEQARPHVLNPYAPEGWTPLNTVAELVDFTTDGLRKIIEGRFVIKNFKRESAGITAHVKSEYVDEIVDFATRGNRPVDAAPLTDLIGDEPEEAKKRWLTKNNYPVKQHLNDRRTDSVWFTNPAGAEAWKERYAKPGEYVPVKEYAVERRINPAMLLRELARSDARSQAREFPITPNVNKTVTHATVEVLKPLADNIIARELPKPKPVERKARARRSDTRRQGKAPPPPKAFGRRPPVEREAPPKPAKRETPAKVPMRSAWWCGVCDRTHDPDTLCTERELIKRDSDLGQRYCMTCGGRVELKVGERWKDFKQRIHCSHCRFVA